MQVNISNKLLPLIFSFQIWKLFRIYLILIYARLILFHDKNTFMLNRHLSFLLKCRLIYWKLFLEMLLREAVFQRCFVKKVLFEILQNSQENPCAKVSFSIKLQARPATLLKKRLWHRCFPVNFAKFQRTSCLIEHLRRLRLYWWILAMFRTFILRSTI